MSPHEETDEPCPECGGTTHRNLENDRHLCEDCNQVFVLGDNDGLERL